MAEAKTRNIFEENLNARIKKVVREPEYKEMRDEFVLARLKTFPLEAQEIIDSKAMELHEKLNSIARAKQTAGLKEGEPKKSKSFVPNADSLRVLIVLMALRDDIVKFK